MNIRQKIAVIAFASGIAGGVMAAPAFGAATPNDNGANCRGVLVSGGNATTNSGIAHFAKDIGISVHDLQGIIGSICEPPPPPV